MTLPEFLAESNIQLSLPVIRKFILNNRDELNGIVMIIKNAKRTTFRVLDADRFNLFLKIGK